MAGNIISESRATSLGIRTQARQDGKRPLGVPTVTDRALQRGAAEVLSAIYEQDFLPC